jgi:hypothetical protein
MAIVEGPALSLRASGNLGSICYLQWRGIPVARAAWTGIQIPTTKQQIYIATLEAVAVAWSGTLSASDRSAWDSFARVQRWSNRLGNQWTPSGYQAFLKMNIQALNLGGVIANLPPTSMPYTVPGKWEVAGGTIVGRATVELSQFPGGLEPDFIQVFQAGPFLNVGIHAWGPDWRLVGLQSLPYKMTINGLTSARYYWFRARWVFINGVVGNWYSAQTLIL